MTLWLGKTASEKWSGSATQPTDFKRGNRAACHAWLLRGCQMETTCVVADPKFTGILRMHASQSQVNVSCLWKSPACCPVTRRPTESSLWRVLTNTRFPSQGQVIQTVNDIPGRVPIRSAQKNPGFSNEGCLQLSHREWGDSVFALTLVKAWDTYVGSRFHHSKNGQGMSS